MTSTTRRLPHLAPALAGLIGAFAAAPAHAAGAFVHLDWRGAAMAQHLSHGPGFAAGATLADDRLRIGIAGTSRPGPWNPATFDWTVPAGGTWRGSRTLDLRSDGGVVGLHLAPRLPLADGALVLSAPVLVGFGGYGFYLHGEDRQTPDGARVSTWENRLLDGADSAFGVALHVGLEAALRVRGPVRPTLGVHHQQILGYEATLMPRYAGPAIALGVDIALP
jgi:hypothetical protein